MNVTAYQRVLNSALALHYPIISKWTGGIIQYAAKQWGNKILYSCPVYIAEMRYLNIMYGDNIEATAYIEKLDKKDLYAVARLIISERYNVII